MTAVNIDGSNIPPFEVIENGEDTRIRISVPGLSAKDIKVWTTGTLLFVETYTVDGDSIEDGYKRTGGSKITPDFKMEFTIEVSATVGGPFTYHGVLNIPIWTKPEILADVREYTVRELSNSETEVVKRGAENWIFKDAHK